MILLLSHDVSYFTDETLLHHFVTLLPFKRNLATRSFQLIVIIDQFN